jgi:hypothetical protein
MATARINNHDDDDDYDDDSMKTSPSSEGSSPCSQQPANGPYPKLDRTNPHSPTLISPMFILMLFFLSLSSGLLPSGFPTKLAYAFLISSRAT